MSSTLDIDLSNVDTSEIGGNGGWKSLASGEYRMMIGKAELRPLKSGNGTALSIEFSVVGGANNGARHFENLNVVHTTSPVAQKIAHEHLANLLDAASLPRDTLKSRGTGALEGQIVLAEIVRKAARDPKYGDADGMDSSVRCYAMTNGAAPQPMAKTAQAVVAAFVNDDVPF